MFCRGTMAQKIKSFAWSVEGSLHAGRGQDRREQGPEMRESTSRSTAAAAGVEGLGLAP